MSNTTNMPFKFLDAYGQADSKVFFGRKEETNDLYDALSGVKLLLIYGPSGAGKTSLVESGLRNQFSDAAWFALSIRRGNNITSAVFEAINAALEEKIELETDSGKNNFQLPTNSNITFGTAIEQLFAERFQPVYLLFDQFEELLILGSEAEKNDFFQRLNELVCYRVPCRILLIMREEFIGHLSEFEPLCPAIFQHRFRLEKMRKKKVHRVIQEILEAPFYRFFFEVNNSQALTDSILSKLPDEKREIELTHVQVFLSELWDRAKERLQKDQTDIPNLLPLLQTNLVQKDDDLEKVLDSFLKKQLELLEKAYGKNTALEVLAAMISKRHTKLQVSEIELQKDLQNKDIKLETPLHQLLKDLQERRLIRTLKAGNETQYEISHDLLAVVVGQNLTEEMQLRQKAEDIYKVYRERQGYFSQDDLDYLRPYAQYKVYPTDLQKKIQTSSQHLKIEGEKKLQGARKRVRTLGSLLVLVLVAFIVAGYFGWDANRKKLQAEQSQKQAQTNLTIAYQADLKRFEKEVEISENNILSYKRLETDNDLIQLEQKKITTLKVKIDSLNTKIENLPID